MRKFKLLAKYSPLILSLTIHIMAMLIYQISNKSTQTQLNFDWPKNSSHRIKFEFNPKNLRNKKDLALKENQIHQELKDVNSDGENENLIDSIKPSHHDSNEFSSSNSNNKSIQLDEPEYPQLARIKNQEGNVVVWVQFDDLGNSIKVKIIESSHNILLDEAALKAASHWKVPPKSYTELTKKIIFKLNDN